MHFLVDATQGDAVKIGEGSLDLTTLLRSDTDKNDGRHDFETRLEFGRIGEGQASGDLSAVGAVRLSLRGAVAALRRVHEEVQVYNVYIGLTRCT